MPMDALLVNVVARAGRHASKIIAATTILRTQPGQEFVVFGLIADPCSLF